MKDFLVIDTEGKEILKEIAIIDSQGKLIYEAFTQEHPDNYNLQFNVKPLQEILLDFWKLAAAKLIIFHNGNHDVNVLRNNCRKAGVRWQNFPWECSCQLAQKKFNNLPSYSLEYLSKKFNLKVNNQYFNTEQAHSARYDAQFTYQLYRKIMTTFQQSKNSLSPHQSNPFASSRVDNPFQDHPDLKTLFQSEFELLKSIVTEIKDDPNHQSKGVVIIGEPGSGKTHLMMRLAKELLKVNRLLFIRCPNNSDTVLYHTYSRILESFVQEVDGTGYSQLEHLLAHSFVKLISTTSVMTLTQRDRDIISLRNHPLDLYVNLGEEESKKRLDYWQHIEKRTNDWWVNKYGIASYSPKIIKGIVKFCGYKDLLRKQLVSRWLAAEELSEEDINKINLDNWNGEIGKEEFSLEAVSVFSKLSLLDEPLIIVFDQLEALGYDYNEKLLFSFGTAIKEIFTHVPNSLIILNLFPDRWEQFKRIFDGSVIGRIAQNQMVLTQPSQQEFKAILEVKTKANGINLADIFTDAELERIITHNSIRSVLNAASDYYRYKFSNIPLPQRDFSPTQISNLTQLISNNSIQLEQKVEKLEKTVNQFTLLFQEIGKLLSNFNLSIPETELSIQTPPPTMEVSEKGGFTPSFPERNPILEYLAESRIFMEKEYDKLQIITDSDDLGKLKTIAESFREIIDFDMDYLRLGKRKIPDHFVIDKFNSKLGIGFLQIDGSSFTLRLKNFNELVMLHKDIKFRLLRDIRQSPITGKVGKEEIEKLNNTSNGKFLIMNKEQRIYFEIIYKLITDIHNRDLEVNLSEALPIIKNQMPDAWIIKAFFNC
jgi:DNA replication protein DnaC